MNYYVEAALAPLQSAVAVVDAQQGYPKAGVNVGGGIHAPGPFITTTWQAILANASGLAWAYPVDAIVAANAIALAGLGLGVPIALDGTWASATSITPSVAVAVQAPTL